MPCEVSVVTEVGLSSERLPECAAKGPLNVLGESRGKPGELGHPLNVRHRDQAKEIVGASVWVSLKGVLLSRGREGLQGSGQDPGCEQAGGSVGRNVKCH